MYVLPTAPLPLSEGYLSIEKCKIQIKIVNNLALITINETFFNPENKIVEGVYLFPISQETTINNFSMEVDGKPLRGEILRSEEAYEMYTTLVQNTVDPALLEYLGNGFIRLSLAPIYPKEKKNITFSYTTPLKRLGNNYYLSLPIKSLKFSHKPISYFEVIGSISFKQGIANLYAPFYNFEFSVKETNAKFAYIQNNFLPENDLVLYLTTIKKDQKLGTIFLTYEDETEDYGYFFLSISPNKVEAESIAKDIVAVIDTSGSMEGVGITSAKKTLKYIIDKLKKIDRIQVFAFNSEIYKLTEKWYKGTKKDKELLKKKVDKLEAKGLTNIYDALSHALAIRKRKDVPQYIIFLTDGEPTDGITGKGLIESLVEEKIGDKRLFVFGAGDEVDFEFLSRLYKVGRGSGDFVKINEIEPVISSFYEKLLDPILSNVNIKYPKGFKDIYPKGPIDLFYGEDFVILGRYKRGLKSAKISFDKFQFNFEITPEKTNEFIPSIWASRKIGHLIEEMRIYDNKEFLMEIVRLSKKYGVLTKYTSSLIYESLDFLNPSYDVIEYEKFSLNEKREFIRESAELAQLADYSVFLTKNTGEDIKIISGRVFVREGRYWIEEGYEKKFSVQKVRMFKKKYMELAKDKDIAKIFALGRVIFRHKDKWIKVVR